MGLTINKKYKTCDGFTLFAQHYSESTKTQMNYSTFLPTDVEKIDSAIIWLSGLTCNEENFITKAGAQKYLAKTRTMIICPDTSPRGLKIKGENDSYDFGSGAGFYVNATHGDYAQNYQMYDYIKKDIVKLLKDEFGVHKISIMGHSMGGHGALVLGLKNPDLFQSVSAFSPIVNPVNCPWGIKALSGYLGENSDLWKNYDACELIKAKNYSKNKILIDQGLADEFLEDQLKTNSFNEVCSEYKQELILNMRDGYDHSYYFISTFIGEHISFHLDNFER